MSSANASPTGRSHQEMVKARMQARQGAAIKKWSKKVAPAVDVDDFAGDVVVLDQKHRGIHNILSTSRALQERPFYSRALLLFRIVFWKQNRPWGDRVHLDLRSVCFGETTAHSQKS